MGSRYRDAAARANRSGMSWVAGGKLVWRELEPPSPPVANSLGMIHYFARSVTR
jgi:hypothetical protein